jgi:hydrogenase small subunit
MSPFYKPLPSVAGFGADVTAEKLGWGLVGATAAATAAHGLVSIARRRRTSTGKPEPEQTRPERAEPVEPKS